MKIKHAIIAALFSLSALVVTGQPIDSLIQRAFDNNPQLKALQLEYEAALQKGPQVSQLPDPTIGLGVPVLRPETRLGAQVLTVSASQMFPWFGTLDAKENVVITMAKTKYERIAAERLELIFQIKNAYYNLYLLKEKQQILRKHVRIFETLERVTLAKVESGKSIASDVLTVRIKIEEFKKQIEVLEKQKQTFNALLIEATNGSYNDTIFITEALQDTAALQFNLEGYRQKIQSFHPLIAQMNWKIETSRKELELNALSGKSSFGFGLDYSLVNARTDAFPVNNGRDILMPKVMVSIPINRKKYTAKNEEERLKQDAFEMQKDQLTNRMISMIQAYQAEYETALLLKELAEKQMNISNRAYDILLAEYSSKGTRFDELMKLQNDKIDYELEIIKAKVQTHSAKIKVDRLTDY